MNPAACLGGWCRQRNACPLYLAEDREEPAERICDKGRDGRVDGIPLVLVRVFQPAVSASGRNP